MNTTSPTLDDAPPDWGAYAAVMADYSEDCNRWRGRQQVQSGQERARSAVVIVRGTPEFETWLARE